MKDFLVYKIFRYFAGYLFHLVRFSYFYLGAFPSVIQGHYLDKKFNIQTDRPRFYKDGLSLHKDGLGYQPTPYKILQKTFDYLQLGPQDIFVDLGSGSGRVVFFASLYKIKKALGIEINPDILRIARDNQARFRGGQAPVEFINADAAEMKFRDENVFFMFHPFGYLTFNKFIANLKESLALYPRRVRIIYFNPGYRIFLFQPEWLELEKEVAIFSGRCLIWRNKQLPKDQSNSN